MAYGKGYPKGKKSYHNKKAKKTKRKKK